MSRGLGKIERAALEFLKAGELWSASDIAAAAMIAPDGNNHVTVPEASYRSYCRALRSLVRAGLVTDLGCSWHDKRRRYALPEVARAYHARVISTFGAAHDHKAALKAERGFRPSPYAALAHLKISAVLLPARRMARTVLSALR